MDKFLLNSKLITDEQWNEYQTLRNNLGDVVRKEVDYKRLCRYEIMIDKAINKVQLIRDIGFDYDGYNDVDNLKKIIDELVDIAGKTIDILEGKDEN